MKKENYLRNIATTVSSAELFMLFCPRSGKFYSLSNIKKTPLYELFWRNDYHIFLDIAQNNLEAKCHISAMS